MMSDTLSTQEPPTTPSREQVGSTRLFAWRVFADDAEAMCIAFAATRNEARTMGKGSDWLCEFEWTEIKAKREPRADKWVGEKPELLDGSGRKSAEVMHALGWSCIDEPSCEWCGAGQWDLVPESRVEEREDHDWQMICDGCYAHKHSQANSSNIPPRYPVARC